MDITLVRNELSSDGTFGTMTFPRMKMLYTVEDDWLDNRPNVSCIPVGHYKLHRTVYHKHGYETFEVMDVPGRSRILIHPANTEEDVQGCIGVGLRIGKLFIKKDEDTGESHFKRAVLESRIAFNIFMDIMSGIDEADLHIVWGLQP